MSFPNCLRITTKTVVKFVDYSLLSACYKGIVSSFKCQN